MTDDETAASDPQPVWITAGCGGDDPNYDHRNCSGWVMPSVYGSRHPCICGCHADDKQGRLPEAWAEANLW